MTFGISSKNPLDYTGPQLNTVPIRRFPRRPLTTDTRYNIGQTVILGPSPSTGSEGEMWYLSRFSSGSAIWLQLSSGGTVAGIDYIESDDGAPACPPDATGTIGILGGNGIVTSGQSPTTDVTIALDCITCTAAGEVTMPLTPAFLAILNTSQNNVTGSGTVYTLNYQNEIFDQNSDYDGTNTFTAPVTGRYSFSATAQPNSLDATTTSCQLIIVTSNRTLVGDRINGANARVGASNSLVQNLSILTDMDAADTCHITTEVSGMVGDSVDYVNTSSNYFSGKLEC